MNIFGKKEKLNPRYVGPFDILRNVGKATSAYAAHSQRVPCVNIEDVSSGFQSCYRIRTFRFSTGFVLYRTSGRDIR